MQLYTVKEEFAKFCGRGSFKDDVLFENGRKDLEIASLDGFNDFKLRIITPDDGTSETGINENSGSIILEYEYTSNCERLSEMYAEG